MTLGVYLGFTDDKFPLTLYFNDFYYFENTDHQNFLIHMPTKQKVDNLDIGTTYLFNLICDTFNLNLEQISIHSPRNKGVGNGNDKGLLYWGNKGCSSLLKEHDQNNSSQFKFEMSIDLSEMFPGVDSIKLTQMANHLNIKPLPDDNLPIPMA